MRYEHRLDCEVMNPCPNGSNRLACDDDVPIAARRRLVS